MMKNTFRKIALLVACLTFTFSAWAKDYNASLFGIKSDGLTMNTRSIQKAIDLIHNEGGGTLKFYVGQYLTGTLYLRSNVTIHLEEGAVLLGSTNPFEYDRDRMTAFIHASGAENIGIIGKGVIDGRGREVANNLAGLVHKGVVEDKLGNDRPTEMLRPMVIYFFRCKGVNIDGITIKNSGSWVQTYDQCENMTIHNITVDSKAFWNNDGIDIVDCKNVTVTDSFFDAADDAICLKSHDPNFMCENVEIRGCVARSSASGIKFGTMSLGGFKNVRIINNKVYDTHRSAITFAAVDGGIVEDILVDSLTSINTSNVIYLRIGERREGLKGKMKNITIQNVYAEVPATKADKGYEYEGPVEDMPRNISPASIMGLPDAMIENVTLKNIEIVYPGAGNAYFAKVGLSAAELSKIPEMPKAYPEFSQFKELPAWGFFVRHAKGVTFDNVTLTAKARDYRPAIVFDDVQGGSLKGMTYNEPGAKKTQFHANKSTNITK